MILIFLFQLLISQKLRLVLSSGVTTGKPHTTVQVITQSNWNEVLNDPANGLWLLKFYGKYLL
jgi:hypothetical protein